MKGYRFDGKPSCAFCKHLGKYITNGRFYCQLDSQIDFEAGNSSDQQPSGYICDSFSEGRKLKENENGIRDSDQAQHQTQKA